MSEDFITEKLAISDLDFEKINIEWIMTIFERILNKKLNSIKLFASKSGKEFAVAEFDEIKDAKEIYDFCDGFEIEDTHELFNLSFVPKNIELGEPIKVCKDSSNFKFGKNSKKSNMSAAEMIDVSNDEVPLEVEVPNTFKYDEEEVAAPVLDDSKKKDDKNRLLGAIEDEEDKREDEGFKFDALDDRFRRLYEDENFIIDTSDLKYKNQQDLKEVVNEKRRRFKSQE